MKNIVKEYEIDIEKLTRTLIDFKGNDKQRLAILKLISLKIILKNFELRRR